MTELAAKQEHLIHLLREAGGIKLQLAHGVRSALAGSHASRFRGRGMDFSEHRHYQPGDDVRRIDWRVTARTGNTHTKLYVEEKERPVFLLADFGASMFFGTRKNLKSVTAAEVGALLTWAAVSGGDRVGGVIAGRDRVHDSKPRAGRRGALAVIHALVEATQQLPQNAIERVNCLHRGLEHLSRVIHPGGLVIVLSDAYALDAHAEKILQRLRTHNDIIFCEITDPLEQRAPAAGRYAVTDGERSATIDTADARLRQRYAAQFLQKRRRLINLTRRLAIPTFSVATGDDVAASVQNAFAPRARMHANLVA